MWTCKCEMRLVLLEMRSSISAESCVGALQLVLRELLAPRQWKAPEDRRFFLDHEQISELCDAAEAIFKDEPSVLHLKGTAPASISTA